MSDYLDDAADLARRLHAMAHTGSTRPSEDGYGHTAWCTCGAPFPEHRSTSRQENSEETIAARDAATRDLHRHIDSQLSRVP